MIQSQGLGTGETRTPLKRRLLRHYTQRFNTNATTVSRLHHRASCSSSLSSCPRLRLETMVTLNKLPILTRRTDEDDDDGGDHGDDGDGGGGDDADGDDGDDGGGSR